MIRHALVPLDGPKQSWKALDCAQTIFEGERITVLHVIEPAVDTSEMAQTVDKNVPLDRRAQEWGKSLCEEARNRFQEISIAETTVLKTKMESGDPASVILKCSESHEINHIVMGKLGQSNVPSVTLGSVAEMVVQRSSVPVTVVPNASK